MTMNITLSPDLSPRQRTRVVLRLVFRCDWRAARAVADSGALGGVVHACGALIPVAQLADAIDGCQDECLSCGGWLCRVRPEGR